MFVDGVAMVGVADDEGVDAVELGEDELQDAEGVHGTEGRAGALADEDGGEPLPEPRALFKIGREQRDGVGDALFGGRGEGCAGGGERSEGREHNLGIGGGIGLSGSAIEQLQPAFLKLVGGVARGPGAGRLRGVFDAQAGVLGLAEQAALDDAGVAVVGAHPVGGVDGLVRAGEAAEADGEFGGGVLRAPVEGVVVAPVAIVQEAADRSEEGQRVVRVGAGSGGGLLAQRAEPVADVGIAQAAGAVLDVGFEVEERVAVLCVALAGEAGEFGGDGLAVLVAQLDEGLVAEAGKGGGVAGDAAEVEQGDGELGVGGVEAFAVGGLAGAEGDLQAAVPELLGELADGLAGEIERGLFDAE